MIHVKSHIIQKSSKVSFCVYALKETCQIHWSSSKFTLQVNNRLHQKHHWKLPSILLVRSPNTKGCREVNTPRATHRTAGSRTPPSHAGGSTNTEAPSASHLLYHLLSVAETQLLLLSLQVWRPTRNGRVFLEEAWMSLYGASICLVVLFSELFYLSRYVEPD